MFKLLVLFTLAAMVAADGTRVEYRLTRYQNPEGIVSNGRKCDRGAGKKCDPIITGSIDSDTPSAAWPGSKPIKTWAKIFRQDEVDSAAVNKIVSKDICNGQYSRANLRVKVDDVDGTHTTPIEQFECLAGRDISPRESSAQWSPEKTCTAKFNPDKVKLNYSWRAFTIRDSECGRPIGGSSPSERNPPRSPSGGRN